MKSLRILFLLVSACCGLSAQAAPAPDMSIVAVVGEDAITNYDLENRIRFIIVSSHLSNTPEVVERIRPQVIRALIDEKLQLQEAAKEKIDIPEKDIDDATAAIESQRGLAKGTIAGVIAQARVPKETYSNQLRAQLSWGKLIAKKIRPRVKVSDDEVQIAQQKLVVPADKLEYKIAVVTIPVDKPQHENDVRKLSEKIVAEVRGGANFEELSRQFAGGSGKLETFWIVPDQLDPAIARGLSGAKADSLTDPVRGSIGYTIVKVYDTRPLPGQESNDAEVNLKQILLKLKKESDGKEADALLQIAESVAKNPGTCQDKTIAEIKDLEQLNIEVDFRRTLLSELPQGMRAITENLKVGEISTPFASNDGIRLYMLCEKKPPSGKPVDRERVYAVLMQQKIELEAQKYIRNLRREAFIEVRK